MVVLLLPVEVGAGTVEEETVALWVGATVETLAALLLVVVLMVTGAGVTVVGEAEVAGAVEGVRVVTSTAEQLTLM